MIGLHGFQEDAHLAAAAPLPRQCHFVGVAVLTDHVWQASRTISAFTVVIITIAILWYVGASSCTSFFFAFQGFLPMQARPASHDCSGAWLHLDCSPANSLPCPSGFHATPFQQCIRQ